VIEIKNVDCIEYLRTTERHWTCCFADPPDCIGLKYNSYNDNMLATEYIAMLYNWLYNFTKVADVTWMSFNSKWLTDMGVVVRELQNHCGEELESKWCVQTFTFGQHNKHDLGSCFRPILRLKWKDAPLYPDAIRIESARQKMGDKRADPRGRVPGDVFDFPRVVGNSKQRRKFHPTQIPEGLIERCIKLSTKEGDSVLDAFSGSGSTAIVCQRLGLDCTALEIDPFYCEKIAEELRNA